MLARYVRTRLGILQTHISNARCGAPGEGAPEVGFWIDGMSDRPDSYCFAGAASALVAVKVPLPS
jgi:hypothetical protein